MRKLVTKDLFEFCRCIRKIGIKEEVKKIGLEANNIKDISERGFEMIYTIFEIATEKKAEKEIYKFLSGPFEKTAEEIENMELTELAEGIEDIADVKTWKLFFENAAKSMK